MKKFWIISLLLASMVANASAAVSPEDLARALSKAPPLEAEYNVPLKFRNTFIAVFGSGTLDKMNAWQATDFSVTNTQRLRNFFTKNHFIHFPKKCEDTQVVKGVNRYGEIICGAKIANILVNVRVTDGDGILENIKTKEKIPLKKDDTFTVTDEVYVSTTDKSLEIAFTDNSLIRLETDTKISLSGIKNYDGVSRLAEVSYKNGLLWGRVLSPDAPAFRHGEIIAWVRGTSIAMTEDGIYALQSQSGSAAMQISYQNANLDIPKCSRISTKNPTEKHPLSNDEHCIDSDIAYKGKNDIILENTKKDIAYFNTLIAENKGNENIINERKISWPETVQNNSPFCQNNPNGNVFWPNVMNASEMCQEEKVFAVAMVDVKNGKKQWYLYHQEENAQNPIVLGESLSIPYGNLPLGLREKFNSIAQANQIISEPESKFAQILQIWAKCLENTRNWRVFTWSIDPVSHFRLWKCDTGENPITNNMAFKFLK